MVSQRRSFGTTWHNRIIKRMLELYEKLDGARIERERSVIRHQNSATDRQYTAPHVRVVCADRKSLLAEGV